jgi:hypothetical protein
MGAQKPIRPVARARQFAPVSGDVQTRQVIQSAQRAADQLRDRTVVVADLVVGDTTLNHGLGRKPRGATVTPTVANAAWAWALKSATRSQMTLTCVGVAQPGATVEAF